MKILLLQLKRIGDLVLTTPAIRCLRDAFPEARLTLVADASCQGLLDAVDVDERWVFDRRTQWQGRFGFGSSRWLARELPRFRGDWCIDFTGNDRSAFFAALSSCRRRITFGRFRRKFLRSWIYSDFVDSSVRDRHTADHYVDLLRPLAIERDNVPLDLRLPPSAVSTARALLKDINIGDRFAVIHAGTARPEKYWLPERWASVAQFLMEEHGMGCVLTGSTDLSEQAHLRAIKEAMRSPYVDLSGQSDLIGLAAIIGQAAVFCGVDTAAMHLADAMRTPAVALFGPTNPFHWRPRHTRNAVLRVHTDEPFTPAQKGGPMDELPVATVRQAIARVLGGSETEDPAS